jgi:hypothetical protein
LIPVPFVDCKRTRMYLVPVHLGFRPRLTLYRHLFHWIVPSPACAGLFLARCPQQRGSSFDYVNLKIKKGVPPAVFFPVFDEIAQKCIVNMTARGVRTNGRIGKGGTPPPRACQQAEQRREQRPVAQRAAFEAQISTKVLRQDSSWSPVHHEGCAGKAALPVPRRDVHRT